MVNNVREYTHGSTITEAITIALKDWVDMYLIKNYRELDEAIDLLSKLPDQVRLHAINRISAPLEQPLE
ncbi:hypothetical protein AGMMS49587_10710 [Spirochaetia bacterium]|nr:hypothetical protein AGMMS49587_10710 [Spirochaetia bacterium]